MSKKSKFTIDTRAFSTEVINSDWMLNFVAETAQFVQQKAGKGYVASWKKGRKRALGMVYTDSVDAMRDQNQNNTLQKAAYPATVVSKK